MLVTITGLGSIWRRRFGANENDPKRFAHSAYFNTTGVPVRGVIRARPKIEGHIRFNGVSGLDPNSPLSILNGVFECADPCVWEGRNKVLFRRMLRSPEQPDFFLVVLKASEAGHFDVGSPAWRSEGTMLISFSEWHDQQEAMLLLPPCGWVRTSVGRFRLRPFVSWPWSAQFYLDSLNGDH